MVSAWDTANEASTNPASNALVRLGIQKNGFIVLSISGDVSVPARTTADLHLVLRKRCRLGIECSPIQSGAQIPFFPLFHSQTNEKCTENNHFLPVQGSAEKN
jgi:hypothetical protein